MPLFASWLGCATYIFSDAWKLFCTAVALLVSPAALPRRCLTYQRRRQESSTQVSRLACEAWQVLRSPVTTARAGSKPAAVQLSEQTWLGLFRKQCTLTPEGRVALPNTLALPSTSTCCLHPRVNALSEPRGSQQTCGSDSPAYMAGDMLTATATATALCWGG